jgi:arylsulfatase A-like enzyme
MRRALAVARTKVVREERAAPIATPARAWVECLLTCSVGAVCAWLVDVVRCAFVPGVRVHASDFAIAALDLFGLVMAVAVVVGLVLGAVLALMRATPTFGRARAFYGSPSRWLREDVEHFAQPLAWASVLGVAFAVAVRAYGTLGTSVHRQELAGLTMGGITVAIVPATFVLYALFRFVFRGLARLLGRLATFATVLVVVGVALIALPFALARSTTFAGVDRALAFGGGAMGVAFAVGMIVCFTRVKRMEAVRLARWATGAVTIALVAFAIAGATYGRSNRVRSVVEQRSLVGARLVRFFASYADRDHDGFAAAFGGGDCDDGDARVYPGAPDPAGDGIDGDCFAGDGSPDVAPRGDGRFSTRALPIDHPNIVVVTIDALRRDHLGAFGYARPTSPHIDAFARTAVVLEGVVPSSTRSLRSIPGMWMGLYPSEIAWGPEYLWPSVRAENPTAAEILGTRGYQRGAVMATNYFQRVDGFFQGFDVVDQFAEYDPPRGRAVDEALPILSSFVAAHQPFLLWVHLFNCHAPYLQDGVPSLFGNDEMGRYDTEITFADAEVQRVLDAIDAQGIAANTVVVVASDHGEAFGEHGEFGHAHTLYEEEMRAVLMIRMPGIAPRRVAGNVTAIDLAPTLVEIGGARMPQPISGESLVPILTGERELDPERTLIGELLPDGINPFDVKMIRRGETELLWWSRDGRVQLFDLASDPDEHDDLSDDRPAEAARLLGELRAWSARASRPDSRDDGVIASHRLSSAPAPSTPIAASYPSFELLGVNLPQTRVHRGEPLPLDLFYHVTSETTDDLFFRVNVASADVPVREHFHCWHYPMHSRYPTTRWRTGEYLDDPCTIRIPTAVEMPLTRPAHFTLDLVVESASGAIVEGTLHGTSVVSVPLGSFDVDP